MNPNFICRLATNHRGVKDNFLIILEREFRGKCTFSFTEAHLTGESFEFEFDVFIDDKEELKYPMVDFIVHWIDGYVAGNRSLFNTTV